MTKSRKLIVAGVLLAGGYGLALLLSRFTDFAFPGDAQPGAVRSTDGGLLATLARLLPHRASNSNGELVPLSDVVARPDIVARPADQPAAASPPWNDRPTWLAATPVQAAEFTNVRPPTLPVAPTPSASSPPEPAQMAGFQSTSSPPLPSGRISAVVGARDDASATTASAWDRWPRWDREESPGSGGAAAGRPTSPTESQAAYERGQLRQPPAQVSAMEPVDAGSERTHVVVDGDSLAKLADRYLDDAALAEEIYRLNRDVLSDPEVLPIGVELRIPNERSADLTVSDPAAKHDAAARPSVPTGMVPVGRTPQPFDDVPRAKLLRPIPVSRTNG